MLHAGCVDAGKKGAKRVVQLYGKEFCEQRAVRGGQATLERYGREYYRAIRRLRKNGKRRDAN